MRFISLTSLVLSAAALFLCGCSASTNGTIPARDLTGNWQFTPTNDLTHNDKLGNLAGSLSSQGGKVTGILHASGGCVASTQDIAFSGTANANGKVTLTSTNLPGNVATIAGASSITPNGMFIQSSLTVTGTGPCAMASSAVFNGAQYAPLSGSYSANLTSAGGATATLTANLTAAAVNADGEVPETGTVTLATSACSSTFSFTGTAIGATLESTLTASESPNATFTGQLSSGAPMAVITLANPDGPCAAGSFTGSMLPK